MLVSQSSSLLRLRSLRAIADRAEGTIARLRYALGGDRPSQTARLTRSLSRVYGTRLGLQHHQSGISLVAPRRLAPPIHSLPPMLHKWCRRAMSGCSKGARGLFVLSRVLGILTETPISPSLWRRQRSSRYAIRAGRNLPDKEFRYLRTVIVTAAVYRGFDSELPPCGVTPPLNLPAPGRRQCLYVVLLDFADTCVFAKQSLEPILCGPLPLMPARGTQVPWAPLLPKLRGHFAEFLLHSSLAHLRLLASPTCVRLRYGHELHSPPRLFSAAGLRRLTGPEGPAWHQISATRVFSPPGPPTSLHRDDRRPALPSLLRPPCGW